MLKFLLLTSLVATQGSLPFLNVENNENNTCYSSLDSTTESAHSYNNESFIVYEDEANQILSSLSKDKYFPYQDIIVNKDVLWKGLGPDNSSRYDAIHSVISSQYNRSISMLDVGASNGYFSIRAVQDFQGQSVMTDMSDRLTDICRLNTDITNKLIYIKKQFSAEDLKKMGSSVHFDLIIGLNVLHHIPEWKQFIEEMFNIADTVIIETPPAGDPRSLYKTNISAIEEEMVARQGIVIAKTPRVLPGKHQNLKKMESGLNLENAVDLEVVASMYLFQGGRKNDNFQEINVNDLSQFELAYPKK